MFVTQPLLLKGNKFKRKVSSNFDGFKYRFKLTAFVKDELKVDKDTANIPALQSKYPYLAPIKPIIYNYADVDLIIVQDSFHAIRPEEYFRSEADPDTSRVAVRLPMGWVLSGPMPKSTGFLSTFFRFNTADTDLAGQIKRGYEIEHAGPTNKSTLVAPRTRGRLKYLIHPPSMMDQDALKACSGQKKPSCCQTYTIRLWFS